jgi:hypothetical protein
MAKLQSKIALESFMDLLLVVNLQSVNPEVMINMCVLMSFRRRHNHVVRKMCEI